MDNRLAFYKSTVEKWITDKEKKILIVAGGDRDFIVFRELGFTNVTISNLDPRMSVEDYLPYPWVYQDAENLTFPDNSYDIVVIHAALHHCYSPHRALLSLYRVAREGVLFIESRDSILMQFLVKFGFTIDYEHNAVVANDFIYGGVENSAIPNYVYRWTEREVEKTILCYNPLAPHRFRFLYGNDMPRILDMRQNASFKRFLIRAMKSLYLIFILLFPKQQNLFACYIEKPDVFKNHFEWLEYKDGKWGINKKWAKANFNNMDGID